MRRYAEGTRVTAFVDPDEPDRVVLERETSLTSMYLLQALGAVLLVLAVLAFRRSRREPRSG